MNWNNFLNILTVLSLLEPGRWFFLVEIFATRCLRNHWLSRTKFTCDHPLTSYIRQEYTNFYGWNKGEKKTKFDVWGLVIFSDLVKGYKYFRYKAGKYEILRMRQGKKKRSVTYGVILHNKSKKTLKQSLHNKLVFFAFKIYFIREYDYCKGGA